MKSLKQFVKDKKANKAIIFIGRFQPVTKAHADIINKMVTDYKSYEPFVFIVRGKKTSLDKTTNPLNENEQIDFINRSIDNEKLKHVHVVPSAYLGDITDIIRKEGFEPTLLLCGTDRVKGYQEMIRDCKDEYKINIDVKEIERDDSDISATKVRQAVVDNDIEAFKELTSNLNEDDFKTLKEQIQSGSSK